MVFISFLTHNQWLLLITAILSILGAFSLKLNIPYQLHALSLKRSLKVRILPIQRELGELSFVAGMTGALLLLGFFFIHFDKFVNGAWIYILVVDLLIFLACFVGFCVATLMYVLLKKIFKS